MEKVAFISGANRGIGFETSKKLAEQGIKVILGSRDMDKGKKALEELAAQGIEADLIQYDAADLEAPQKVHDLLGCRGVTRSDFKFYKNKFYLLEINTQPGMTKLSLVPEISAYKGINFINLLKLILKDAETNK